MTTKTASTASTASTKDAPMCVLSIDVGIRNMACCKADVVAGAITRIRDWRVIDLCPDAPTPFCVRCATTGKKRAIKAALQHPVIDDLYLCLVHARQEQFGFFPQSDAKERRKQKRKRDCECDDDDDAAAAAAATTGEQKAPKNAVDAAIATRTAVSKSTLRSMTLVNLRAFAHRHPGFADMSASSPLQTKSAAVDALAAHMTARTWRRRPAATSSTSAATISVVTAGMRFAAVAQSTALFAGVDELVVENQLGFVAARMKSMQDVVSCMAVFAGVPVVRAVSAATKLRILEPISDAKKKGDSADADDGFEYRNRKAEGIAQCRAWMKANPVVASAEWTDAFEKTKKKDDMADALLQLLGQLSPGVVG